jgi:hypothetical protein
MFTCLREESAESLVRFRGFTLLSKISIRLEVTDASVAFATAEI